MEDKKKNSQKEPQTSPQPDNKGKQGVDKAPGDDKPVKGKLTEADLKGKKVDRDINDADDEPLQQ
jgi:hypothetical protein